MNAPLKNETELPMQPILITGGAGFIGGNFVHHWCENHSSNSPDVVVLDILSYAGNPLTIEPWITAGRAELVKGDIADVDLVTQLLQRHQPQAILHFAAESHVDRSISGPAAFIHTNLLGTFNLLEAVRSYWMQLPALDKSSFRFLHVSTDEVYGTLGPLDKAFNECTPYAPNSPYAASKAGSDHLVRAYHQTYGLPTLTTNCSNNYGPYQFPEKLIPLIILNALTGKALPIYGDGQHIRDWLYVRDHCEAICQVLRHGAAGNTYNIGNTNEIKNIDVVQIICRALDKLRPNTTGRPYEEQIVYVADRPGHDRRYSIDSERIQNEIGWKPIESFSSGIEKTIHWYLNNEAWIKSVQSGAYLEWLNSNYANR